MCIGVGGRAGIGRTTLVDALAAAMAGYGPLTVGELPACNDPRTREIEDAPADAPADGAAAAHAGPGRDDSATRADAVAHPPPPSAVPVDIAVHMVLGAPAPSDRRAIDAQGRRGVPVLVVRARLDEREGDAREPEERDAEERDAEERDAESGRCGDVRDRRPGHGGADAHAQGSHADGSPGALAVAIPPDAPPQGLTALVECLSAGAGRILAARADACADSWRRRAVEGPGREQAERFLASARARELRAVGARGWGRDAATAEAALRAAARWRAAANAESGQSERARALAWYRRYVDRAAELGAAVQEAAGA